MTRAAAQPGSSQPALIQLRSLSKTYHLAGQDVAVLQEVSCLILRFALWLMHGGPERNAA